jgi:hypothetical protein
VSKVELLTHRFSAVNSTVRHTKNITQTQKTTSLMPVTSQNEPDTRFLSALLKARQPAYDYVATLVKSSPVIFPANERISKVVTVASHIRLNEAELISRKLAVALHVPRKNTPQLCLLSHTVAQVSRQEAHPFHPLIVLAENNNQGYMKNALSTFSANSVSIQHSDRNKITIKGISVLSSDAHPKKSRPISKRVTSNKHESRAVSFNVIKPFRTTHVYAEKADPTVYVVHKNAQINDQNVYPFDGTQE